jgi:hypothetical protein
MPPTPERKRAGLDRSSGVVSAGLVVTALWGPAFGAAACTDGTLQVWSARARSEGPADAGASMDSVNSTTSNSAVPPDAADVVTTDVPLTGPFLVDDFEDGDTRAQAGLGWWYTQSDTAGQQTFRVENPNDATRGAFCAHHSGFGFSIWGALFGLDFTQGEGALNASGLSALRFQARAGEDSVTRVSARLLDPDRQYAMELELSTEWREYTLPFQALVAVDGSGTLLDPSRLSQLHIFIFSAEYFDLWLDDFVLE